MNSVWPLVRAVSRGTLGKSCEGRWHFFDEKVWIVFHSKGKTRCKINLSRSQWAMKGHRRGKESEHYLLQYRQADQHTDVKRHCPAPPTHPCSSIDTSLIVIRTRTHYPPVSWSWYLQLQQGEWWAFCDASGAPGIRSGWRFMVHESIFYNFIQFPEFIHSWRSRGLPAPSSRPKVQSFVYLSVEEGREGSQ